MSLEAVVGVIVFASILKGGKRGDFSFTGRYREQVKEIMKARIKGETSS